MKISITFLTLIITFSNLLGQSSVWLSAEEAQQDLDWLKFSLEYTHPRLYKYQDKSTLDGRFHAIREKINGGISGLDFLRLTTQLNASVNCGHLYTIPQEELRHQILDKKVMPYFVKIIEGSFYVFNDCSYENPIPNGSRIVSINGKSGDEIYQSILPGIATDGYIHTRKERLIERYIFQTYHGFDLYFYLFVDRGNTFNIVYEAFGSQNIHAVTKAGITMDDRKERLLKIHKIDQDAWFKTPSPKFELHESTNHGVLTISRSFFDEELDPNYDSLLRSVFKTLEEKEISNLIIDLRDNEGGSEHQQMELISYLYDQPFKLYQNIYQSHIDFRPLKNVIMERDTAQLLFNNDDEYMRRLTGDIWINNYEYSRSLQLQPPKEAVFTGQLYVLINGITFSSAADMASNLKKTTNAIFIGEETGGAFEGPTGGTSIVVQLPNSKIMVRISPNVQIGYKYRKHPIGRGVIPDHKTQYDANDWIANRDLEMEKALQLIQRKSD